MSTPLERDRQVRAEHAAAQAHFHEQWQCGRKASHRHTVSRLASGPPMRDGSPRRSGTTDRCNSAFLWSLVAYAVLDDKDPYLDGKPFTRWSKADAWAYLGILPKSYRHGRTDPSAEEAS
jgi:hypothetical protein